MRHIALEVINERKLKILSAVIHHYVKTAKPVGSNILIEEYGVQLSPAAVRNVMAELEKEELLNHPHTSAGRVPTDKGYRVYVDSIAKLQQYAIEEEERLRGEYEQKTKEIESVLSETSRILSGLSQYTGFVTAPKAQYDEIKTIELVPITEHEILVILITHTGSVKHKRIEIPPTFFDLTKLRNFLNDKLRGTALANASKRIVGDIQEFRQTQDNMMDIAEKICDVLYDIRDDLYIDGTSNTIAREIALPDFDDFEPIKSLIRFNENKDKLIEIINKNFDERIDDKTNSVNVTIGSENSLQELKDLSIVTTLYKEGDKAVGVLGIIGPKRMEYKRMMALVNSVSKALNDFLLSRHNKGG
jgi:heat-inducible transcriptional repressor